MSELLVMTIEFNLNFLIIKGSHLGAETFYFIWLFMELDFIRV